VINSLRMIDSKNLQGLHTGTRGRMVEANDPTGWWRFFFWSAYVLGTMSLLFSWLLAQVPQPSHGGHWGLDYAFRSCVVGLMMASILIARRVWKLNTVFPDQSPVRAMQIVLLIAYAELAMGLVGIIGLAVGRRPL
jgi:hypothetical protein